MTETRSDHSVFYTGNLWARKRDITVPIIYLCPIISSVFLPPIRSSQSPVVHWVFASAAGLFNQSASVASTRGYSGHTSRVDFSVDTGERKHQGKPKAAEHRTPHTLVSRLSTDVSSVPPSRSSETLHTSLASHFNPPQVPTACVSAPSFHAFASLCEERHFLHCSPSWTSPLPVSEDTGELTSLFDGALNRKEIT